MSPRDEIAAIRFAKAQQALRDGTLLLGNGAWSAVSREDAETARDDATLFVAECARLLTSKT